MSKLNWRKCHLQDKPIRSIIDENEWRGKDAAARWLERKDKPFPKPKSSRLQPSREVAA